MANYGIPGKIIRMVQEFYDHFSCVVELEGKHPEWFHIKSGVSHGWIPFLTGYRLDKEKKNNTEKGVVSAWED